MPNPLKSPVSSGPPRPIKTHLIEEYKARANTIRCDCGWTGSVDGFAAHRREKTGPSS
jgi:hypothetical protein